MKKNSHNGPDSRQLAGYSPAVTLQLHAACAHLSVCSASYIDNSFYHDPKLVHEELRTIQWAAAEAAEAGEVGSDTSLTIFSKAWADDLIQPDLPRASFISYLTAPAMKTNRRMDGI